MDDIKTSSGRVVGSWNGERARDLMAEIARIKQMLIQEKSSESLDSRSMPHRDQLHQDLLEFKAYHLWGAIGMASAWWEPTPIASKVWIRCFRFR